MDEAAQAYERALALEPDFAEEKVAVMKSWLNDIKVLVVRLTFSRELPGGII